jgi:uncharacterized protein with HEPN domain
MSKRDTRLLLEDIIESAQKVLAYTNGMSFSEFIADDKTVDPVIRNFEIIGEAASRLPTDFCSQNPKIAWHQMIGMRNRLIHAYFGVDYQIIWSVVKDNLPHFKSEIEGLLSSEF